MRVVRLWLVGSILAACASGGRHGADAPTGAPRIDLVARPVVPALGMTRGARYVVSGLPAGHGYEAGRLVALMTRGGLTRPVGLADIVTAGERELELVALWVEPSQAFASLELGPVPQEHHFGKMLGRILEFERDPRRVRVNLGAAHGARAGDIYSVLGDAHVDADVGGRSLGRGDQGTLQIVEVDPRGQTAVGELLRGRAEKNAFVMFAGHEQVQRRPVVKIVLTRFRGDRGGAYSEALLAALQRLIAERELADLQVEATEVVIDLSDAEGSQARRVGAERRADVVLWGSANSAGESMMVVPRVTFVDPARFGERERLWSVVKMDEARIYRDGGDEVAGAVRGLAAYMAGWVHFAEHEQALDGSYARAAGYFQDAIVFGEPVDARNARVWLFYCLERLGDLRGAERVAREVEAEGENDEARRALGSYLRATIADDAGASAEALTFAQAAALGFTRAGAARDAAVARSKVAEVLYKLGERDAALRIYREELLPVFDRLRDARSRVLTLGHIADIHAERGRLAEAGSIYEELLVALRELSDDRSSAVILGKLAELRRRAGAVDEALRIYTEEVLPVFVRLSDVRAEAVARGKIADIWLSQGRLDAVLREREAQLRVFRSIGDEREEAVTLGKLAEVRLRRGEAREALRIRREEQLPMLGRIGDVREYGATQGKIAEIQFQQGDLEGALAGFNDSLVVHERIGERREGLVCRTNVAVVLLARGRPGDRERAAALLREVLAGAGALTPAERARVRAIAARHGL